MSTSYSPASFPPLPPVTSVILVKMMNFSETEPHKQTGGTNLPPALWDQFKKWTSEFSVCGFKKKTHIHVRYQEIIITNSHLLSLKSRKLIVP